MGGLESGNWYRFDKTTTEECHGLDIRDLYRKGLLKPGTCFRSSWSPAGKERASVRRRPNVTRGAGRDGVEVVGSRRPGGAAKGVGGAKRQHLPGFSSDHLEVEHHRCLVLEDVAVEHVELLALEVVGEVYGPLHGLPRPKEHCVLEA